MSIEELYRIYQRASGITTDTRTIGSGTLYFALKGEKFDGNSFALQALEKGASYAVVDDPTLAASERCIYVEEVLTAMQHLARHHRRQFHIPVIALTGSNGKTTNKELITRVLSSSFKVHATQGNLNNHIGVPLTLLRMPLGTEIAVVEMGANHQQEIKMLCEVAEPTHGLITNLGKAHLEGFGGEEGVRKGKGELYDFLKASGGTAFVNSRVSVLQEMVRERQLEKVVFYGEDANALQLLSTSPTVVFQIPGSGVSYPTHMGGQYNFDNMQNAYAVGRYFGVPAESAAAAIANYQPDNNRSQYVEVGSNAFLMDAYNANPSSMEASLKNFAAIQTTRCKVVVLGDMFELGEYAEKEHAALGQLIQTLGFDYVVLFGEQMRHALIHLPMAYYFTDKFSMHNWLLDMKFENTFFLVKGSRSTGLESVLRVFQVQP